MWGLVSFLKIQSRFLAAGKEQHPSPIWAVTRDRAVQFLPWTGGGGLRLYYILFIWHIEAGNLSKILKDRPCSYHGSWTHLSEKADSRRSGRNACQVEYNRAILHTPVLPVHTAAELVETERAGLINDLRNDKKQTNWSPQKCSHTAAVLVLPLRTVGDAVAAQYGGQAAAVQTPVLSSPTATLRGDGAGDVARTRLFVWLVGTVQLAVTPPAHWDALEVVRALVLVHATGERLGSNRSWSDTNFT